jgi:hypothetical protein
VPRQNRVRAIHLTLARPLAILRAMRRVPGTTTASRSDVSTRRDLLLEILALRHQVAVLARSNRRFRTSDRLLWLMLRRLWPRWRDALSLVQPATVDRWHRDGRHRWWRRRPRTRRPGRPPINEECRALIRRMAHDNRLWGAPRIHGELLKLGITVSERTVSRYLSHQRRPPSQTWRTFLTNQLCQLPVTSPALSPCASGSGDVIAIPSLPAQPMPWVRDGPNTSHQCVRGQSFAQASRMRGVRDYRFDDADTRHSGGRDPPRQGRLLPPTRATASRIDASPCVGPLATNDVHGPLTLGPRFANQHTVHFYCRRISRQRRQEGDASA